MSSTPLDRINFGTLPDDGTGDPDRTAFQKADAAIGVLSTHLADTGNPHQVTAAQVGSLTAGQIATAIATAVTAASAGLVQTITTNNGHLILVFKDNSTKDLGSLLGPQGPGYTGATVNGAGHLILTTTTGGTVDAGSVIGPTGTPGTVLRTGSGAPSNALGIDGDLYLNTNATTGTGDLYQRASGTYTLVGNLRGPAGTGNVNTSGSPTAGQLALFSSGTTIGGVTAVPAANFPALTGDVTTTAGSLATALAASGVTAGSYTNPNLTIDGKGRVTSASNGSTGVAKQPVSQKSAAYSFAPADIGYLFVFTGGPYTIGATAPSTLTNGWWAEVRNADLSVLSFTPGGSVLIDGLPAIAIYPGESFSLLTDGANFFSVGRSKLVTVTATTITSAVSSFAFTGTLADPEITAYRFDISNLNAPSAGNINLNFGYSGVFVNANYANTYMVGINNAQSSTSNIVIDGSGSSTVRTGFIDIVNVRTQPSLKSDFRTGSGTGTLTKSIGYNTGSQANFDSVQISAVTGTFNSGTIIVRGLRT